MKEFKIESTTEILELIDNVEMSVILKRDLKKASKKYRFLCELSVLKFYKVCKNIKIVLEFEKIYPNLKNESGFMTAKQLIKFERKNGFKRLSN